MRASVMAIRPYAAWVVSTLIVIAAGCSTPRERGGEPMTRAEFMSSRTNSTEPVRADDMAAVDALTPLPETPQVIVIPQPVEPDLPSERAPAPRTLTPAQTHPAALALLNEAMRQEKSGDYELAAAKLERALRIEPRNPLLWNRLANIRLRQGQNQLAANLAAKSNSYAANDAELLELNQRIITRSKTR